MKRKKNTEKTERKMSIRLKVIGIGGSAIILSIVGIAVVAIMVGSSAIEKQAFNQLEAVNNIKKTQIESFFFERGGDIKVLANSPFTKQAVNELGTVFEAAGGSKSGNYKGLGEGKYVAPAEYRRAHDKYFPVFKHYMEEYGYYDIFLMHADDGETFLTVTKEPDFGTRVSEIDSSLRDVWEIARKEGRVAVSDTKPYKPSNDAPAQFIAYPVKEGGRTIGILAFQISIDAIGKIMKERSGMGKTGESYLVGKDKLMRSDSFIDPENHSVAASFKNPEKGSVDTEAVKLAFEGKDEIKVIDDYNGNPVLSAYQPVKVGEDVTWAMMSEIDEAEVAEPVNALRNYIIIIAVVIVAIAGFIFFLFVNRSIVKPIMLINEVTAFMAQGDLTKNVDFSSNDELGELSKSFNTFIKNIHQMVSQMVGASQNLAQAVEQIASGNQTLSQRTSEQASSLEEIASTVEEAAAAIKQNAENSEQASTMSDTSYKQATEGGQLIKDSVTSINEINETSKQIGDIISVINEIAFQTNLLALNAAVEAARAGEQGRGFAVVAGEVRNLAQRSGNAAKEIGELIKNSVDKIEAGTELANKSGDSIKEIIDGAEKVSKVIAEISTASIEQRQGIEQINTAVVEMDSMTQQNASLVEETASASEEMSNQAEDLLSMTRQFTINGNGRGGENIAAGQRRQLHARETGSHEEPGKTVPGGAAAGVNGNGTGKDETNAKPSVEAKPERDENLEEAMKEEGLEQF